MHVERFYSKCLDRHWSVADGAVGGVRDNGGGRPHSLWLSREDAEEMAYRLEGLAPIASVYKPMHTQKEWQS